MSRAMHVNGLRSVGELLLSSDGGSDVSAAVGVLSGHAMFQDTQ